MTTVLGQYLLAQPPTPHLTLAGETAVGEEAEGGGECKVSGQE